MLGRFRPALANALAASVAVNDNNGLVGAAVAIIIVVASVGVGEASCGCRLCDDDIGVAATSIFVSVFEVDDGEEKEEDRRL